MVKTIFSLKELAESKGGKCLSDNYIGCKVKYKWQCEKGHEWETYFYNIKLGHWCPVCSKEKRNRKWEEYRASQKIIYTQMAESMNGECLSDYKNLFSKMKFKCSEGHEWETLPLNIKSGHWCPICSRKNRKRHLVSDEDFERIKNEVFG